jgi:hypothetical protein
MREFWLREANQTVFLAVTQWAASRFCRREAPKDVGSGPTDRESGECRLTSN